MGMTMAEKILAGHSGRKEVRPGDLVDCSVDVAVMPDGFSQLPAYPRRVWDPDRIYIVPDHLVPAPNIDAANGIKATREFAKRLGLNYVEIGKHGITHQIIAEQGLALPGTILANGDSHACASGAFNCAARGLGLEMLYVLCKGRTWFLVGPTVRFIVKGKLPEMVLPRDAFLHVAGVYGAFPGANIEWVGPTIEEMSIEGRQSIATMGAEVSAEFALFECDDKTVDFLRERTDRSFEPVFSDPNANYQAVYEIDVSDLQPQVALPGKVPSNVKKIDQLGQVSIDQAYLGSCAAGRLEDIAIAAEIVSGREVAPGVRFIVTPASQQVYADAVRLGYVSSLVEAGAVVTNATCGACFGGHMGVLADGEVCISASPRNFQGRMGSSKAQIFLGSPAVVAASSLKGYISDPRWL